MELKRYKLSEIIDCFISGDWGEEKVNNIGDIDLIPYSKSLS